MLTFERAERFMMQRLAGKTAIITGASGIGRAVAQRLYAEGASLVLASLPEHGNAEDIDETNWCAAIARMWSREIFAK